MSVFLERVDSAPLETENFGFEFTSWIAVFIDTLNETLRQVEEVIISREVTPVMDITGVINSAYIIGNPATTTITLPAIAPVGSVVEVVGQGAGGWILVPAAGQTIKVVAASASVSVASTNRYDCLSIICVVANTTWVTRSSQTGGFVIT